MDLQVQYWPEPQQKETYGNIIVSGKNEEIVNDALCTRTLELVRSGTLATVSQHLPTRMKCLCKTNDVYKST